MTKMVFAGMETTQTPMVRYVRIRTNSTDRRFEWLLSGRKRPQKRARVNKIRLALVSVRFYNGG
jgi:hypothetical protein